MIVSRVTQLSRYIWWCHRFPERSWFYRGEQLPVCTRCTGIWLGYLIGLPLTLLLPLPWWSIILLVLPAIVDGGTQLVGWRTSTNWLRFTTGIFAGVAEMYLLIWSGQIALTLGYSAGQRLF